MWTREQQDAIDARGGSLLVAAAAGSGKTAVLTQRILALCREGASVDRMLVVTFTNAAAAEMRARILAAFSAEADAGDPTFAEQAALVERAAREELAEAWRTASASACCASTSRPPAWIHPFAWATRPPCRCCANPPSPTPSTPVMSPVIRTSLRSRSA